MSICTHLKIGSDISNKLLEIGDRAGGNAGESKDLTELAILIDAELRKVSELTEILERFCTKSNGLSTYFRVDWRDIKNIYPELEELYEIQCEAEKLLGD